MVKKTLVVGATPNPERYANKAVKALQSKNIDVVPLGIRTGRIKGLEIIKGKPVLENIHTVSLYVGPLAQQNYHDYIIALQPKRVIFNPGTEHSDFAKRCEQNHIEAVEACTLVMLATGQY